jgi:hypothetical protein
MALDFARDFIGCNCCFKGLVKVAITRLITSTPMPRCELDYSGANSLYGHGSIEGSILLPSEQINPSKARIKKKDSGNENKVHLYQGK